MTNRAISGRSPRDYSGRMGNSSSAKGSLRHPHSGNKGIELKVIDGEEGSEIEITLITTGTRRVVSTLECYNGGDKISYSMEGYNALDRQGKSVPFCYLGKFDPEQALRLSEQKKIYTMRYGQSRFLQEYKIKK